MPDITSRELEHELLMTSFGEERYFSVAAAARSTGRLTTTPPGRQLLRAAFGAIEAYVSGWARQVKAGRPAPHADVAPIVSKLDLPSAAFVAAGVVADGLHRPRSVTSLAAAVGLALEDEHRIRELVRTDRTLVRELLKRVKRSGPEFRRRYLVKGMKNADAPPPRWSSRDRAAVGAIFIEAALQELGWIEVEEVPRRGRQNGVQLMARPTEALLAWLDDADRESARRCPTYLPTLDPPAPWSGVTGGGYLTDAVLRRPLARFASRMQQERAEHRASRGEMPRVLGAVNKLQDVPWRIDRDLLEALDHLRGADGGPLPDLADAPLPARPAMKHASEYPEGSDDAARSEAEWKEWRKRAGMTHRANAARRSSRVSLAQIVRTGRILEGEPRFYFPHRLDFRQRAYPVPYWVQPQGPDYGRAMIQFAGGEDMTDAGWRELWAYGESLKSGTKGPVEGRAVLGRGLWSEAESVYRDPIEDTSWHDADEPFQYLAWCLEVGRLRGDLSPATHLPVHIDASNNGLQLFALMTGDEDLAAATNAIDHGSSVPEDLYSKVAADTWAEILRLSTEGCADPISDVNHAEAWRRCLGFEVPRDLAKRPVMTLPYGVTAWSAAEYVLEWYRDKRCADREDLTSGPLGRGAATACRWLAGVLMEKVAARCRGAVDCMTWLQDVATKLARAGLPFEWTTPVGWPAAQAYRKQKVRRLRVRLGGQVRQIRLREDGSAIDVKRQRQGAAPNFVHSIDAAVMATAVSGWAGPIAAIHDSFGTAAPLVPALRSALRSAVAEVVVENNLLVALRDEVRGYSGLHIPDPPVLGRVDPAAVRASEFLFQ